jgi:hypothetical protein
VFPVVGQLIFLFFPASSAYSAVLTSKKGGFVQPAESLASTGFNRQRKAAILFAVAAVSIAWVGLLPHVLYRFPLALIATWGLWKQRRWGFPVAMLAAVVWISIVIFVVPFLLVAPPWELWFQWLYWLVPTSLVIWAIVLLNSRTGREERRRTSRPFDNPQRE